MHGIPKTIGRMAAACCLMLAIGGAAVAQETRQGTGQETGTDTYSLRVSLHGIDLCTAAGRKQATQRIAYAIRRDYREANPGSVITPTDEAADQDTTLAAAMSQLQLMEAAAGRPASFAVATSSAPR